MKNSMNTLFCLLLMGSSLMAQSQTSRTVISFENASINRQTGLSAVQEIPLEGVTPFLSYFAIWENPGLNLQIRFSSDARQWTEWKSMVRDEHNQEKYISGLQFTELSHRFFQIKAYGENGETGLIACHFYNPGQTPQRLPAREETIGASRACPCPFPSFLGRSQWCPDNNCPEDSDPVFTNITHMIVHHSAGVNSSSDWSAVVRSIWDLHVNGNGWADIGYNWLIDPNGKVYLGRGNDIRGAHFCGFNAGTMGVCVIGNFTNIEPTIEARSALKDLLSWKACDVDIDPLGSSYHQSSNKVLMNISGHRDGCATECPGNMFYPLLGQVREAVAYEIIAGCSGLPGPTALSAEPVGEETVQLAWMDNTTDEEGYRLERSLDDNQHFEFVATLDPNTVAYNDSGLTPGATYFYRLQSFTATDASAYSNEAVVMLAPSATDQYFNDRLVKLAPNPVTDILEVNIQNELVGTIEVTVTDMAGRRILQKAQWQKNTVSGSFELALRQLPAGIYLLQLQLGLHRGGFRIVKL